MDEVDHHVVADRSLSDSVELTVVEDVAVLVDLNKRGAAMSVSGLERFHHVLAVKVVCTSDE